ncbi:hypothetical protein GH865_13150 [Rhodocyclus tenuis]|uniref:hypothetical protein n=1 Tax=Rhodocyclus gracilis TaxID=2929842 RepID=UPI001298B874|nr:hypothetical protein [Rhodocyclus gracilis]MRD74185.1 hypothetical protein [Rhodocyclus gracilis]
MQEDLQHLDATIKLFDPEYDLRTIRAKEMRQRNHYFDNGECHRLMLEALRELGGRANTAQIVQRVSERKGFEADAHHAVYRGLDGALRRAASTGLVVKNGRDESGNIWKLADLAQ